jgi:hypothetical protein
MVRVGGVRIHRVVGVGLALLAGACSSHPPEGTLVEPGPGVAGLPGGRDGVRASRAVPISGGTLLVASDGVTAIAADPDRDRVFLTNLDTRQVRPVVLEPGDEPGRSVQDGAGRVHVALRSGGAVVAIDLATASIVSRTAVCGAPRGIAYDAARDLIHVACQGGELVSLNAATSEIILPVRRLDHDLRDVIVDGDRLIISRFRSAELLVVGPDPQAVPERTEPTYSAGSFEGSVAWRTVAWPGHGVLMLHQRADLTPLPPVTARYYGTGPCDGGLVQAAVGVIDPNVASIYGKTPLLLPYVAGPTDIAVSRDSQTLALVATGNSWDETHITPRVVIIAPSEVENPDPFACSVPADPEDITGEPTAVAFDGAGRLVVQSREPAQLQILGVGTTTPGTTIPLSPNDSRLDTGIALFHMNSGGGVACASCHPEGTDDGRTWNFNEVGLRRTQFVAGRMLDRAPYHWNGDLGTFRALVDEVFVRRMGAVRPNTPQAEIFGDWLNSIEPPVSTSSHPELVETGRALFNDPSVGCTTCHAGSLLTDSKAYDVGTGGMFKVPSLIGVGSRAPYLHNGCAATLADRFGACGGGDMHGTTSQLSAGQVDALVAYLETL